MTGPARSHAVEAAVILPSSRAWLRREELEGLKEPREGALEKGVCVMAQTIKKGYYWKGRKKRGERELGNSNDVDQRISESEIQPNSPVLVDFELHRTALLLN